MIERIKNESGYSLVEVLVAILILSVAIIPMVGMFDAGLRAASLSGDYDKARSLANRQLEQAKSLDYETVRTTFPNGAGAPGVSGSITSSSQTNIAGFPANFSYTVEKRYLQQPPADPASTTYSFATSNSADDTGLIRVTVTVTWADGKTYVTTGLVAR